MKKGKTINELAAEITRQANAKKDYIVEAPVLKMEDDLRITFPVNGGSEGYDPTEHAHGQMAAFMEVPKPYYNRLRASHPELLVDTFNTLMPAVPASNKKDRVPKRMVRTLDGSLRAFLSNKYRLIENVDLGTFALEVISSMGGNYELVSCEITERKLYLKVINNDLTRPIKGLSVGDTVAAGFVLSNSEIGLGGAMVAPYHKVLSCLNGMMWDKLAHTRKHVGRAYDVSDEAIYSDDTRKADDEALLLRMRDEMFAASKPEAFEAIITKVEDSVGAKIEQDPIKAVEVVQKRFGLNDKERTGVLQHLLQGGNLNKWGVSQALTRHSQDVEDYDRATEFEQMGPAVIEMPPKEWEIISTRDPKTVKAATFSA